MSISTCWAILTNSDPHMSDGNANGPKKKVYFIVRSMNGFTFPRVYTYMFTSVP